MKWDVEDTNRNARPSVFDASDGRKASASMARMRVKFIMWIVIAIQGGVVARSMLCGCRS